MTARTFPIRSVDRDNEVVRAIYVKSSTDRDRSISNYHHIKVGVAQGSDKVDWLGEWSQGAQALTANSRFYLSGEDELNYQLDDGDEIVVWHDSVGSPASVEGLSVEIKGSRYGAVGAPDIERRDGAFPAAASPSAQLFTVGSGSEDVGVETLAAELNESGVSDWEHTFTLPTAESSVTQTTPSAYHDYTATQATISSTTYVDGSVSVSVALPSTGATSAYVLVTAFCTMVAATGQLRTAISDGSSEVVETWAVCESSGDHRNVALQFAGEITADTTYTIRFKKTAGSANIEIDTQGISALLVG